MTSFYHFFLLKWILKVEIFKIRFPRQNNIKKHFAPPCGHIRRIQILSFCWFIKTVKLGDLRKKNNKKKFQKMLNLNDLTESERDVYQTRIENQLNVELEKLKINWRRFLLSSRLLCKISPVSYFFNGELHIILKLRKLDIGEHFISPNFINY